MVERAFSVDEVVLREVGLASLAVKPLVLPLVDVPALLDSLEELLHVPLMALLSGTDEVVVAYVEYLPSPGPHLRHRVRVRLDVLETLFFCSLDGLHRVLIESG